MWFGSTCLTCKQQETGVAATGNDVAIGNDAGLGLPETGTGGVVCEDVTLPPAQEVAPQEDS